MARRTVNLPDSVEADVRELTLEGESFSATVTRLLDEGMRALRGPRKPSWIGSGEGPEDLGINAEKYLRELADER
ncbi:MAG: hypothetical protein MSC30_04030 [Gaiellaceae bacterium MAG52_C11]|nr:hypothetical protein [Candidatus Gaiellasilicea maunaloa]